MVYIPDVLRRQVADRAKHACEYCLAPQYFVVEMEIDHIIPVSLGGENTSENLCLSCRSCNGHKKSAVTGIDSLRADSIALFHPRKQIWDEHFQFDVKSGRIEGISPIRRATVRQLSMNAPDRVKYRLLWVSIGLYPPNYWRRELDSK